MIIYNTVMGVCAGVALILGAELLRRYTVPAPIGTPDPAALPLDKRLWAAVFAVLGVVLAGLGMMMSTRWPLTVNPPVNILFGEPSLLFGVMLCAAAAYLWRTADQQDRPADLTPVGVLVFAVGLILAACAVAIARFGFVGAAPEAEPISGRLHAWPWLENTFFAILYGMPAAGALAAPFTRLRDGRLTQLVRWAWTVSGVVFLLFSALNYYTHIGLLWNLHTGSTYRW